MAFIHFWAIFAVLSLRPFVLASPLNASEDFLLAALERLEARIEARATAREERIDARFTVLFNSLQAIEEAVVTVAKASSLEACAPFTVLPALIIVDRQNPAQCSAVPMPLELLPRTAAAAESHFFLTAAHCFIDLITRVQSGAVAFVVFKREVHNCTLFAHHLLTNQSTAAEDIDAAIIFCGSPVPVPPTRLSTVAYAPQLPVAIFGYSNGEHMDVDGEDTFSFSETGEVFASASRHVRHTRLTNSLQHPLTQSSAGTSDIGSDGAPIRIRTPAHTRGYLTEKPEKGMSGGAVVDSSCGVLGITERQSQRGLGGRFVRLTHSFREWVARAISGTPSA